VGGLPVCPVAFLAIGLVAVNKRVEVGKPNPCPRCGLHVGVVSCCAAAGTATTCLPLPGLPGIVAGATHVIVGFPGIMAGATHVSVGAASSVTRGLMLRARNLTPTRSAETALVPPMLLTPEGTTGPWSWPHTTRGGGAPAPPQPFCRPVAAGRGRGDGLRDRVWRMLHSTGVGLLRRDPRLGEEPGVDTPAAVRAGRRCLPGCCGSAGRRAPTSGLPARLSEEPARPLPHGCAPRCLGNVGMLARCVVGVGDFGDCARER